MFQSDSGRTACVRPLRHSSVAPGMQKAEAPTKGLSELNSMAFGFAVYASWSELPQYHAKLASSCWSGSTERDSHPQGSAEGFQICRLHLIPPSQACLAQLHRPRRVRMGANSRRCAEVRMTDASKRELSTHRSLPPVSRHTCSGHGPWSRSMG
jgi:hypothetical protein